MWATPANVSGLVAWYALIADVLVGSMFSGRLARYAVPPKKRMAVHRLVGYGLVAAVAVHVSIIVADNDTLSMRVALGFGIAATATMAVVVVTSGLRRRMSRRQWHRLHRLSFVALAAGTVHSVMAGPDQSQKWLLLPGVAALTLLAVTYGARRYHRYAKQAAWRKAWQIGN